MVKTGGYHATGRLAWIHWSSPLDPLALAAGEIVASDLRWPPCVRSRPLRVPKAAGLTATAWDPMRGGLRP